MRLLRDIRQTEAMYGGRFTSYQLFESPDEDPSGVYAFPPGQWMDIRFPGSRKYIIWYATIETAREKRQGIIEELAFDRAKRLLSPEELEWEYQQDWKRESANPDIPGLKRLLFPERRLYPQFDGLSYFEYVRKLEAEILANSPPPVYEEFRITRYALREGIDLRIVIDADRIDQKTVERAMDRFFALGEQNWRAPEPVHFF